jgi:hypothetical protein
MNNDDSANNDPIAASMGISPIPNDKPNQIVKLMGEVMDDSAKKDFTTARSNILDVIDSGKDALDKLVQIAGQSQHPRAFEVVAKLIDTLLVANKDLLEIQQTIREIDAADSSTTGGSNPTTVNNNLFVGSSTDLQKILAKMTGAKLDRGTEDKG